MRVEVTEERLKDAGLSLVKGDIVTVPDEVGKAWCRRGWARDTAGVVPTGPRIVRGEVIDPQSGAHAATDSNVEG
jgi:hypothetical protein